MLKRIFLSTLLLLLTFSFSSNVFAAQKFVNGIDASYPPFAFIDKDGKPSGFDVDAMNWIADKMGFEVEHVAMDWSTIITSLLQRKIDMVCSGMSISPERSAVVTFSDPYYSIHKFFLVHKDSKLTSDEILTGNKRLGVQGGTNEAFWLEEYEAKNNWNYELVFYASPLLAVEDLVNGRIDAAAIDSAPAYEVMGKGGKPVVIAGEFADGDDFGVATRNEDKELRDKINEGYRLLKTDPYWEELKAKYDVK